MRALLDVCTLIALIDKNHVNHVKVAAWFAQYVPANGWASCPLTQNGTARIIGLSGYPNPQPPQATLATIARMAQNPVHQFWQDSVSLADAALFDPQALLTPNQLTDVYLLGLAVSNGGKLVTTDRNILTTPVIGFTPENLQLL